MCLEGGFFVECSHPVIQISVSQFFFYTFEGFFLIEHLRHVAFFKLYEILCCGYLAGTAGNSLPHFVSGTSLTFAC